MSGQVYARKRSLLPICTRVSVIILSTYLYQVYGNDALNIVERESDELCFVNRQRRRAWAFHMRLFGKAAMSRRGTDRKMWREGVGGWVKSGAIFCFFMFDAPDKSFFMKLDNCLILKDLLVHHRCTRRFTILGVILTDDPTRLLCIISISLSVSP